MKQRSYTLFSAWLFAAIAVLHALRLFGGWEARIAGWDVPQWVSVAALLISGVGVHEAGNGSWEMAMMGHMQERDGSYWGMMIGTHMQGMHASGGMGEQRDMGGGIWKR